MLALLCSTTESKILIRSLTVSFLRPLRLWESVKTSAGPMNSLSPTLPSLICTTQFFLFLRPLFFVRKPLWPLHSSWSFMSTLRSLSRLDDLGIPGLVSVSTESWTRPSEELVETSWVKLSESAPSSACLRYDFAPYEFWTGTTDTVRLES